MGIRSIKKVLVLRNGVQKLAIDDCIAVLMFSVNNFICTAIMLYTSVSIAALKSLSSFWRFLFKLISIYCLFSAIVSLSLSNDSAILSCSSSFHIVVVKLIDSSDCIPNSTTTGSTTDGDLFCFLCFRKFRIFCCEL